MKCGRCGAENPATNKYCGGCGALIAPEELRVRDLAVSVFEEQFKRRDQKLLEFETATGVFKLLGIMAIPISIAIVVLGWAGFGKYNTAIEAIATAKKAAVQTLQDQTEKEAQNIRDTASNERSSLQVNAQRESTKLQADAEHIRTQTTKSYSDVQAQIQQNRGKLHDAELQINQLQSQGTAVRDQYDALRTQLAVRDIPVNLTENVSTFDQVLAASQRSSLKFYSVGSSGPEVEDIQTKLKELGCYSGEVTGKYDTSTKEAVERFNRARGEVFPSGVVDDSIWDYLHSALIVSSPQKGLPTSFGIFVLPVAAAVKCPSR